MKRSTFLNGYVIVLAILIIATTIAAFKVTNEKQFAHAAADIWIWVVLLDIIGALGIYVLIREMREEEAEFEEGIRKAFILEERIRLKRMFEEMEDARNECELNSLESQSPEC
jgi:hypothetical protein